MTDDDDKLTGIDLSAWEPPPPAGRLADAVIARMREPAGVAALETAERGTRRWWIIGGAAAMIAVAAVIATWGLSRVPKSGRGDVVAVRPGYLDLGPSSAVLDPGADVRWERSRHRLHATQSRGAATWRVGGGDTIVIDAGAMVASVEATGASLRVEVHMNLSDARILGASAITAAAVAMVTVIVYEGHVKVRGGGQTVHVTPGTTVEVLPEHPPRAVMNVGAADAGDRELALARAEIARLENELEEARKAGGSVGTDPSNPPKSVTTCDEVSCVLSNYDGPCCQQFKKPEPQSAERRSDDGQPETLDRAMISEGVARIKSQVMACADGSYQGELRVSVRVGASGAVTNVWVKKGDPKIGRCVIGVFRTAKFAPTRDGGAFSYPWRFPATRCDSDKLKDQAEEALGEGNYRIAHDKFEEAYSCRREATVAVKALVCACNLRSVAKAKRWWKILPPAMQTQVLAVCVRNGISRDQLEETCEGLKDQGQAAFASGNYATAHDRFEAAYRCKADPKVAQMAFIVGCNLRSADKAKRWWKLLTPQIQSQVVATCIRNGIARDDLE